MPAYSKLRRNLDAVLPPGIVTSRALLVRSGFRRSSIDNVLKSGQLVSLWPGIYGRPGFHVSRAGLVSSLQRMGSNLVLGGVSALERHGRNYYIPLSSERLVNLYGQDALPPWVPKLGRPHHFHKHGTGWLFRDERPTDGDAFGMRPPFVMQYTWKGWPVRVSMVERAMLEVLHGVSSWGSFDDAEHLMQGMPDLHPTRLRRLLSHTRSVKVKRLLSWLADRVGHPWTKQVRADDFDLGIGKRSLARLGKLVSRFGITVPPYLYGPEF